MLTPQHLQQYTVKDFPLSAGRYEDFISEIINLSITKKPATVCVANVHMFIEAYKDASFLDIVKQADIVTPDGRPLIWAIESMYHIHQERVAGMDLLPDLLQEMEKKNISVFFYGGTAEMLYKTKIYLSKKYPALKIAGAYDPPFGTNTEINDDVILQIKNALPCVVFVILGCPKQEKFMAAVKDKVSAVMIGVGGALPVMIGMQKRAPMWMQNIGLEWLFRLGQEPRRLFKRYFYTNSLFVWIFLKEFIQKKILKR